MISTWGREFASRGIAAKPGRTGHPVLHGPDRRSRRQCVSLLLRTRRCADVRLLPGGQLRDLFQEVTRRRREAGGQDIGMEGTLEAVIDFI